MSIQITDFIAIPEDFIIEEHLSMRKQMGIFKFPNLIKIEHINKINAVIKTTGFLKVEYIPDAERKQEEEQAIASTAAYLMCLDELGLIMNSFKKFSLDSDYLSKEKSFEHFIDLIKDGHNRLTIHIINIFPLIQNSKFYLQTAVQNLLRLDDIELDRQETLDKLKDLD